MERIYFDNAATTPVDPRVIEAMQPFGWDVFGNPSSLHAPGREARAAVDRARAQVAALIGAQPTEIIFTASGTEADNLALLGTFSGRDLQDSRIVTSTIEHPAVLETCRYLEGHGVAVTYLPVDGEGLVDPDAARQSTVPGTRLVSVMVANNVVGAVEPIRELGRIAREQGVLFHTDAVQAAGHLPIDVRSEPVDLLSISAHKLHGPKGVGALYVRDGVRLQPLIHGGGQERGLRSATENVAGIVGFGRAAEIARSEMSAEAARLVALRDRLIEGIVERIPGAYLIGPRYCRLPGHVSVAFAGQEGEAIRLLLALDEAGVAVSSGSACSAQHAGEPSYVLRAMGFDPFRARGSLRLTLGRFNTEGEVESFLDLLPGVAAGLNSITTRRVGQA